MAVRSAALSRDGAIGAPAVGAHRARATSERRGVPAAWLFACATGALVAWGWKHRADGIWIPDSGLGYLFGAAGGTLLALTPLYSMRKRLRSLRSAGRLRHWFRSHMVMGTLGPVLILFHCNFQAGSTNSTVALASMLVVVASGLVGRYLYGNIHRGLDGHRAVLGELLLDAQTSRVRLQPLLLRAPHLYERVRALEALAQAPVRDLRGGARRYAALLVHTRSASLASLPLLARAVREQARVASWGPFEQWRRWRQARKAIRSHLAAVRNVAKFSFYERLFTLWHLLHLPLFWLLVIAGVVHVVAVHLY